MKEYIADVIDEFSGRFSAEVVDENIVVFDEQERKKYKLSIEEIKEKKVYISPIEVIAQVIILAENKVVAPRSRVVDNLKIVFTDASMDDIFEAIDRAMKLGFISVNKDTIGVN